MSGAAHIIGPALLLQSDQFHFYNKSPGVVPDMPSIHVYMHEGRTVEQKKGLVEDITAAIVKNTGAPAEATEVIIHDVPRTNWAVAGKLASES